MNEAFTSAARFVGQRIPRKEDARLLTGRGAYVDDIVLPGMVHAAFVRSPIARGKIKSIDIKSALAVPGVRAVFLAKDLGQFNRKLFTVNSAPDANEPAVWPLAVDRVAHVGEPVALVLADNRYIAEDGAALVDVDYVAEDAVVTIDQAMTSPPIHPDLADNAGHRFASTPDPEFDAIFASAAHVTNATIDHQRQSHAPMETRGVVVSRQGTGEITVYISCQSPHLAARYLTMLFDLPDLHFRVISKDVGGAFGLKVHPWREECAVVAAGLIFGRPIKWFEDRIEALISASQAREQHVEVRLAFDKDAKLLAADVLFRSNVGAYPQATDANPLAMMMFPGPYRLPKYRFNATAYFSNTSGQAPYRGPWAMESLARETAMDVAAREMGIDPIELRLRNLITAADLPIQQPSGITIDGVTPRETLEAALKRLDLPAFRAEQAKARAEGRNLGLGVAVYIEPTTLAIGGVLTSDSALVRVEPTGKVSAVLSTHSQGHGTQTTMAQIVADHLGVAIEDVTILEDDSSRGQFGPGAGASRQAVSGGGAAIEASKLLNDKIKAVAAHLLNAPSSDVQIVDGKVLVNGVEEVTTTLKRIAEIAYYEPDRLPHDMQMGLEAQYRYRPPPFVFSNAAHLCVCEVDGETGIVAVKRWIASEDCGVMINPSIVEGQIAGGVVQGIGSVLYEEICYDRQGNPTTATFKDYLLPGAHDVPTIEYCHMVTPSTTPGGFKGVGEGGAIIGPPTMVNAVADALAPKVAMNNFNLPLTPPKLLALLDEEA